VRNNKKDPEGPDCQEGEEDADARNITALTRRFTAGHLLSVHSTLSSLYMIFPRTGGQKKEQII
jgi:hypothetical protein